MGICAESNALIGRPAGSGISIEAKARNVTSHLSSTALRFTLLGGLPAAISGGIVAKRDVDVSNQLAVQLNILEASHLVTYAVDGWRLSEMLACQIGNDAAAGDGIECIDSFAPVPEGTPPATPVTTHRRYQFNRLAYELHLWRAPLNDPAYAHLMARVRANLEDGDGDGSGETALLHYFNAASGPQDADWRGDMKAPLTALLFDAESWRLHSAHTYPDEDCIVMTTSRLSIAKTAASAP